MRNLIILLFMPIWMHSQSIPIDSLLDEQLDIESRGKHMITPDSIITSPKGAIGIAQFMPSTWQWMKDTNRIPKHYNIVNESHQRAAHKIYMRYLFSVEYGLEDSLTELAFASYNAGSIV